MKQKKAKSDKPVMTVRVTPEFKADIDHKLVDVDMTIQGLLLAMLQNWVYGDTAKPQPVPVPKVDAYPTTNVVGWLLTIKQRDPKAAEAVELLIDRVARGVAIDARHSDTDAGAESPDETATRLAEDLAEIDPDTGGGANRAAEAPGGPTGRQG